MVGPFISSITGTVGLFECSTRSLIRKYEAQSVDICVGMKTWVPQVRPHRCGFSRGRDSEPIPNGGPSRVPVAYGVGLQQLCRCIGCATSQCLTRGNGERACKLVVDSTRRALTGRVDVVCQCMRDTTQERGCVLLWWARCPDQTQWGGA